MEAEGSWSPFQLRMPRPLQGCYIKALELDESQAYAWFCLGLEGGGIVKGKAYDEKDRPGGGGGDYGFGPVRVCGFRS